MGTPPRNNEPIMCLFPKLIKNRKYVPNKKNKGIVPEVKDQRVLYVPVGCQKCIECKKQKARGWSIRLQEEIRHNKTGIFVTLTFSNAELKKLVEEDSELKEELKGVEGYEADNAIATRAVRLFLERWRKKYGVSIKHWLVTELGHNGTENIHLHGLIFLNNGNKEYLKEQREDIKEKWGYGFVYIGDYVSDKTINYISKYITKTDLKHKEYNAKILTSKGIGSEYANRLDAKLNRYNEKGETKETYTTRTGAKIALPIYFRNKIYSESERENLWLQKLDKQERWICGERVSIKNGYHEYENLLKWYQAKNRRLGYGDNSKNWDRITYENNRRKLQMERRLTPK